jgi:hypothetical protein
MFQIAQFGEYVWGIGDHVICKFNVDTISHTVKIEIFQICECRNRFRNHRDLVICKFNVDTIQYHIPLRLSVCRFVSVAIESGITLILFPVNLSKHTVQRIAHFMWHSCAQQYHIPLRSRYCRFVSAAIDSGITVMLLSVNLTPHKTHSTVHSSFHVTQLRTAIIHTAEIEPFQGCECSNRHRNHRDLVTCGSHSMAHFMWCSCALRYHIP